MWGIDSDQNGKKLIGEPNRQEHGGHLYAVYDTV